MKMENALRAMLSALETFDFMRRVHELSIKGYSMKEGKLRETFWTMIVYMDDTAPHFRAIGLQPPRMQYELAA